MFFAVPAATIDREVLTAPSATIDNDRCWHYGGMHAGALIFCTKHKHEDHYALHHVE